MYASASSMGWPATISIAFIVLVLVVTAFNQYLAGVDPAEHKDRKTLYRALGIGVVYMILFLLASFAWAGALPWWITVGLLIAFHGMMWWLDSRGAT